MSTYCAPVVGVSIVTQDAGVQAWLADTLLKCTLPLPFVVARLGFKAMVAPGRHSLVRTSAVRFNIRLDALPFNRRDVGLY